MTKAAAKTEKMTVSETDVAVELVGMNKWYGNFHVLRDIDLKVMRGERIVVAGPSGSGKSTSTIVQEMQAGYMIKDRLLRPAMVGVAKAAG